MNENLNLVEILKDCPKETVLYSPICGECKLEQIYENANNNYPICVTYTYIGEKNKVLFTKDGKYIFGVGECMLFPSKSSHDWNKFSISQKICNFKPFDKVLVCDGYNSIWRAAFFSHLTANKDYPYSANGTNWKYCIPYEGNENLVGTSITPDKK